MNFPPDGVYFDMPEDTYHSIERYSNSGVKHQLISDLDFWAWSWMNPDNKPDPTDPLAEKEDERASMFKLKGSAYHCRLLEGAEAFASRYGYSLDPAVFKGKDVLRTSGEIEGALKAMGIGGLSKLRKAELADLLLLHDPNALIWDKEVEKHAALHPGCTLLPHAWRNQIELGAAMIEKNPHLCKAFTGGFAEVTVLWTKEITDGDGVVWKIPMKAKLDYVKPDAIIDFKTFSNRREMPIDKAVISAMAERKNHIQAGIYYEAGDELAAAIKANRVFIWSASKGVVEDCAISPDIEALASQPKTFVFIFQQTGRAPVAVGRIFPRGLMIEDIGRQAYEAMALQFAKCLAHYGTDPWVTPEPVKTFETEQFPIYMGENAWREIQ